MAQSVKNSTRKKPQPVEQSNDNLIWISGIVMVAIGLFAIVSVVSHFFNWSSDISALNNDKSLSGETIPFENFCNGVGAKVGYLLVDKMFGVCGLIIPIVLTMIGWRIFRKQKLSLNHFVLSSALVLIMGSLTFGVVDCKTEMAHDLGGALGVMCADELMSALGVGVLLVLLVGWILTGVFINRNFISKVNKIDKLDKFKL